MGKLIRNGIEYGGGNGTDIFEVTQSEYDALKQAGTLVRNALYVISDGENLNPTADDIEYSSGVDVKTAIDGKQNTITVQSSTITPNTTDGWAVNSTCKKMLNVVTFAFDSSKSSALASGWNTIGTLPSGYIPDYEITAAFIDPQNDIVIDGKITANTGYIQIYKTSALSQRARGYATFIV